MRIDSSARRTFLGGSDARVVMGQDESALFGFGGRSEASWNRRTYPETSLFSLASRPSPSTGTGSRATPARPSRMFSAEYAIR